MFKHANTVFPNDVVIDISSGDKTAGHPGKGKVVDADPSSGKVKVAWDNGEEEWKDPGDLEKVR